MTATETKEPVKVVLEHSIPRKRIADLLDSASRGAQYWASDASAFGFEKNVEHVMNDDGVIVIHDDEESGKPHSIMFRDLVNGLRTMAEDYPGDFANFMEEEDDQNTGDVFLQCVVFGRTIYG